MTHLRKMMLEELERRNYAQTAVRYRLHACRWSHGSDTPRSTRGQI